jgi:hypothetical protein
MASSTDPEPSSDADAGPPKESDVTSPAKDSARTESKAASSSAPISRATLSRSESLSATSRPSAAALPYADGDRIVPNEGYTLGPEIGKGEYGQVFRALAPGGFPVAVKRIIRPLSDEMCQRELRALELIRQLRHPYLLPILAY